MLLGFGGDFLITFIVGISSRGRYTLSKEGLIDDFFIRIIMKCRHTSRFNVYNKVRSKPDDEKGIENLSQYIICNTFSLKKLKYEKRTSSVLYRSKMTHDYNKKNFQVFTTFGIYCSDNTAYTEALFPGSEILRLVQQPDARGQGKRKG